MCARYTISDKLYVELEKHFGEFPDDILRKTGDVYPSEAAPIVVAKDGILGYETAHWGYPGFRGKGLLINARAETVEEKRTFQHGIRFNRCVIPASGFYEWDSGKNKALFSSKNKVEILYLAGFFDVFDGAKRFVIITTEANESVRRVHERMPLLVQQDRLMEWLVTDQFRRMLVDEMPLLKAHREYEQLSLF